MLLRFRNVKLSTFDPETKKWTAMKDRTVLVTADFIYHVESKQFYEVFMEKLKENEDYATSTIEKNKRKIAKNCFRELLDQCLVTDKLPGVICSGKILWRIEREENPSFPLDEIIGTTEIIE